MMSALPNVQLKAAIYARCVSRPPHHLDSINDQVNACSDLSLREGWYVTGVYNDTGQSGNTLSGRFGFDEMIGAAKRGEFDHLVVSEIDRLARSQMLMVEILGTLAGLGIGVWTAGTGLEVVPYELAEPGAQPQTLSSGNRGATTRQSGVAESSGDEAIVVKAVDQ
jgi:hypothetical protein